MLKLAALLALAALPALANPTISVPQTQFLLRDSDGIVISIIDYIPRDYFPGGVVPGGVYYTFGGVELEAATSGTPSVAPQTLPGTPIILGGANLAAATAQDTTLQIGAATYRVEAAGGKVWLRDVQTGLRYATVAHTAPISPDAKGMAVNPAAFALD